MTHLINAPLNESLSINEKTGKIHRYTEYHNAAQRLEIVHIAFKTSVAKLQWCNRNQVYSRFKSIIS